MKKRTAMERLFDMNDTTISASTVFMIITSIISCVLLIVPAFALVFEVITTHTISTDLSGMAAYIGASAAVATSGGLVKGWSTWSNYKYNGKRAVEQLEEKVKDFISEEEECETI